MTRAPARARAGGGIHTPHGTLTPHPEALTDKPSDTKFLKPLNPKTLKPPNPPLLERCRVKTLQGQSMMEPKTAPEHDATLQGYLARKKQPSPLGPPYDPKYSPTVGS